MEIENYKDIRLVSRSQREGWNVNKPEIVQALMRWVSSDDPKMSIAAANILLNADKVDAHREALAYKTGEHERARLLDIAKHIPVRELVALASESGVVIDATVDEQVQ